MRNIIKVFGRSPFVPLQMHMDKVGECVHLIPDLIAAYRRGDSAEVRMLSEKASQLEHEADNIKQDIRNSMPRGLFMPIQRASLLNILRLQDKLANRAEDIGVLLTFKQAKSCDGFDEGFDSFIEKSLETFDLARDIIQQLDELLETGFGGAEARKVREMVDEVAAREHETDVAQRELVRVLLANEGSLSYGDFFLWTGIIREVAGIADRSESLAMAVRNTLDSN